MVENGGVIPISSTGEKYHFYVDDRYGADDAEGINWQTPLRTIAAAQRDITIYSRVNCRTYARPYRPKRRRVPFSPWRSKVSLVVFPKQRHHRVDPPSALAPSPVNASVITLTGFTELD
jgi:hypothetical protein